MPGLARLGSIAAILTVAPWVLAPAALACNVPVYRYALERWPADDYEAVVFHDGPLPDDARPLIDELRRAAADPSVSANVTVRTRDVSTLETGPDADVWDLPAVRRTIAETMRDGYDFVFTHLPVPTTHGHHKAATILALEAAASIEPERRPVILGATVLPDGPAPRPFAALDGYPSTAIASGMPLIFDRTQSFGYRKRLNYKISANWVIAEHKSQGTMQLAANRGDLERYWLYKINRPGAAGDAAKLFEALAGQQYPEKTYGPSAGKVYAK